MNNTFPENCTVCQHCKTCQSLFGGRGCRFEKEIIKEINKNQEEVATL